MSLTSLALSEGSPKDDGIVARLQELDKFVPGEVATLYAMGLAGLQSWGINLADQSHGLFPSGPVGAWLATCIVMSVIWVVLLRLLSDTRRNGKLRFPTWPVLAGVIGFLVYGVGLEHVFTGVSPIGIFFALSTVSVLLAMINRFVALYFPEQAV